ncbi:MAG: hypothetical protein M3N16_02240 [Actinomycetota bacterium]|nr:hypothetical protein [Actinomycetota bacterium]
MTSDEADLVRRARAGEREAFEHLVRRYADRLYAVVLRFVADADEAEEITQETFLRLARHRPLRGPLAVLHVENRGRASPTV